MIKEVQNIQNNDIPDDKDFDDDASAFATKTIESASGRDIYDAFKHCPDDVRWKTNTKNNSTIAYNFINIALQLGQNYPRARLYVL